MKINSILRTVDGISFGYSLVTSNNLPAVLAIGTMHQCGSYKNPGSVTNLNVGDSAGRISNRPKLISILYSNFGILILLLFFQSAVGQSITEEKKESKGVSMVITAKRFILPNGQTVSIDKLDSVNKAWNHVPLIFHPDPHDAEAMYVLPKDSAYVKKELVAVQKIMSLLNQPAPDFNLRDLDGKVFKMGDKRGKVIVMNFWFTTCGSCIVEMPELNRIKARYNTAPVIFLGLARDNEKNVRSFLKKHAFKYTILPEAAATCLKYNIFGYPTSIVVDKAGIVSYIQQKPTVTDRELSAAIDKALGQQ